MYVADGKLHIPEEQETLTEWMDVYFRYRSAEDVVTLDQIETLGNIFNSTYLCDFYNEEDVANMLMDVCYEQGGDGLYYGRKENGWYDRNWNLVIPVPTFSEGVSVVSIGDFSGGFAPIALIGADEKYYFTMIDKTGNLVYEPVGGVERAGKYYFKDGKIAFSDGISLYVIDRDGTLLDPSEDISAFAGSILLKDNSNKAELMINEGFKYIAGSENIYKKLDGTPFDQAVMDENTVHVQFPATSAGN